MDYNNNISDLYTSIDIEAMKTSILPKIVSLDIEISGEPQEQSNEIAALVSYIKE